MKSSRVPLPIVAKIETALGVANIKEICQTADAVMLARGDLALATPWEELFNHCMSVTRVADEHNVPWILATQLAEGLERFQFPTRAEICDLAHWLTNGASGAMLSYETAFGSRPIEAVVAVKRLMTSYATNAG
jgi:pyruvate kinase